MENIIKDVKDLEMGDLVEMYNDLDSTEVLTDEWCCSERCNTFVYNEDDCIGFDEYFWNKFESITRVWRINDKGDYELIYKKSTEEEKDGK